MLMGKFKFGMGLALFCLLFLCFSQSAQALANEGVKRLSVGDLEITLVTDRVFPMDEAAGKKLMPDLVKHPEYLPLFERVPIKGVCQVFFFRDGQHNVLVDSGWGQDMEQKGELLRILKTEGVQPGEITDIILTHMDFDHIGGLLHNGEAVFPNASLWISAPEYEAWKNGTISKRPDFALKLAREVIEAYKDRLRIFNFGEEILPGISAIDARGHTPGHTAYQIRSGNDALIIAGDLMHLAQVQLPLPELNSVYDMDATKAADSRKAILEQAVQSGSVLGGMHFPMLSKVLKNEQNGYLMREPR